MNSKTTWTLTALAVCLFAFIWFFERHIDQNPDAARRARILPQLNPRAVTSIQIRRVTGEPEIRAERTNGTWVLTKPFAYPAVPGDVETLLALLQSLPGASYISAPEMKNKPSSEFGFDPPQIQVFIQQGSRRDQILVGKRTALGNEFFLQVVGVEGAYIVDARALDYFPRNANDWRNPVFADMKNISFDRVSVTNMGKIFELQRAAGKSWRMTQPIKARADNTKIDELLRRLPELRVEQFISDDPKADLETFGLQPPELSLGFAQGTNNFLALQFGKSPTNDAKRVFAKIAGQNSVVLLAAEPATPWRAKSPNDFRERRLLSAELADIRQIEIHGAENFIVQKMPNGSWQITGTENSSPDVGAILELVRDLNNLEAADFITTTATDVDFRDHGFTTNSRQYILRGAPITVGTNSIPSVTNNVLAEIHFGSTNADKIFARRPDENSIYAVKIEDYKWLPAARWQMRERRIWNFSENDVAGVTVEQNGKSRRLLHAGTNRWATLPASQDVNMFAVEETMHRLGGLTAAAWLARGGDVRKQFGIAENSRRISIELKNGDKQQTLTVEFGDLSTGRPVNAAVSLDGQTWIFESPRVISEMVELYLTTPAAP